MVDYSKMIKILDTLYPIDSLFNRRRSKRANVKCPFHDDKKASAHIYPDGLYCFTCGKTYRASKIAKEFGFNLGNLYKSLIEEFGTEEELLRNYDMRRDITIDLEVVLRPKFNNERISDHARMFFNGDKEDEEGET